MKTELLMNENGVVEVCRGKSVSGIRLGSVPPGNDLAREIKINITEEILGMAEHHNISVQQLIERMENGEKFKRP